MRSVLQTITASALLGRCIWSENVQLVSGFVSGRPVTRRRFTKKLIILDMVDDCDDDDDGIAEDPDGVPIFDTNDRPATFLGLEPVAASDESDPPLQVTGPIVMILSIYVTLSLFFGDGMPL